MAWRVEKVPAMSRVDIKEYTWNNDCLFFQEFLEESLNIVRLEAAHGMNGGSTYETVIERRGKLFEVEPDVESTNRRNVDVEVKFFETSKDVIPLLLEMLLQSNLFFCNTSRVK
jgi:hypothetical protein